MGEPLIIIGHHKEEFVFGEFLRETMGKTNPNLSGYVPDISRDLVLCLL